MSIIKTPEQVEKMRISGALLARCLDMVVTYAKPGRTGKELDTLVEEFIRDHNAIPAFKNYGHDPSHLFPASLCLSINEQVVHGIPTEDTVLEEGDLVTIDCGLSLDGWFADAARLFGVGEITPIDQDLIDWTKRTLDVGIAACRTGNKLGDVSYAIQVAIAKSPYFNVVQFCGHAIGTAMHEEPQVPNIGRKGTGPDLKPGMVFCLEPMLRQKDVRLEVLPDNWTIVTRDHSRATHIEEMVLITDKSPEILTA
jgi:methionyl aminopeptidase